MKRRLIIAFYALNSHEIADMHESLDTDFTDFTTHNNVHNGIEKRAENMFELCCILHFVIPIMAGESSFSIGDNRDSTVDAFVIAPVSALDFGSPA